MSQITKEFGHWLAGFTDGEGCFGARLYLHKQHGCMILDTRFAIGLRADDRPILEYIRKVLGVGMVYPRSGQDRRIANYIIGSVKDLYHIIIPLFEQYPLRSKKAKEFEIWKKIIIIKYLEKPRRGRGRGKGQMPHPVAHWKRMEQLVIELHNLRQFQI